MILDMMILFDSDKQTFNVFDSAGVEIIVRDLYGIVLAFENVVVEADTKTKKKVRWGLRREYDLASLREEPISVPSADRRVARDIKQRAAMDKLFETAGSHD